MKILYRGPICSRSGYGQACHDNLIALRQAGLDFVGQLVVDADTEDMPDRYKPLLSCLIEDPDTRHGDYTHVIVHSIPILAYGMLDNIPPKAKRVLVTTWETSILHDPVVATMNGNFDLIIVPSRFNADSFIKSGVDPLKIVIIPHAYDPVWWDHGGMRAEKNAKKDGLLPDTPYTFYNIGAWATRKNPMGPITAYMAEFGPDDNVCFKHVAPRYYKDEIVTLLKAGGIERPPRLEIIGVRPNFLTDGQLRQLHREADCYVTLARGEGFGLGAFEATLAGNPVISTGWSGLREFLDQYPGTRYVPHFMAPCLVPPEVNGTPFHVGGIEIRTVLGPNTGIAFNQEWAEPDVGTCRKFMRRAYESRNQKDYRVGLYEHILRERFTYEAVGRQFKRVLESL